MLIVVLIISLLNIIVLPERGAFVELKIALAQIILLSIPLLILFLIIFKWTGDCWRNSKLMFALIIVCLIIALSIRSTPKGTGAVCGIQESCVLCILLVIRPLNTNASLKGTGAFWELKIDFANCHTYHNSSN